jgi:hypothetical protein
VPQDALNHHVRYAQPIQVASQAAPCRVPAVPLGKGSIPLVFVDGCLLKAIGGGRTNPLSRMKAATGRWYMLTWIATKTIRATPPIGTGGLASPFAVNRGCGVAQYCEKLAEINKPFQERACASSSE